jgi:hypothetical protein
MFLRNCPAAHLSEAEPMLASPRHFLLHCPSKNVAFRGLSRSRVPNPQIIESGGMALFGIAEACTHLARVIHRQDMPALVVDRSSVAAVRGQILRTDSPILDVDLTPKTLHRVHEVLSKTSVIAQVSKNALFRMYGGRKDYELGFSRFSSGE